MTDAQIWALIDGIPDRAPARTPKPRRFVGSRPRKPAHIANRRRWAASGMMPANLAHHFTLAEQAVLGVIAHEVKGKGDCRKSNPELADMAGVSVSTVKNALREAKALGFIVVTERRLNRWRNDTNVVAIVSAEWRTWLRLGGGDKFRTPIKISNIDKGKSPTLSPQSAGLASRYGVGNQPMRLDPMKVARFRR